MAVEHTIAVLSAMPQEIRSLKNELLPEINLSHPPFHAWAGQYGNARLVLISAGVGAKAAVNAMETALQHFNPSFVINTGYAGSAHPDLSGGDMVIAKSISSPAGQPIDVSENTIALARNAIKACGVNYMETGLVTVPTVVNEPADKAMWGTRHNAFAIDMESYYIARICKKAKIPFLIVRSILDPLVFELPSTQLIRNDGSLRWYNIAKMSLTRPLTLMRLASKQMIADKSLSLYLKPLLSEVYRHLMPKAPTADGQ